MAPEAEQLTPVHEQTEMEMSQPFMLLAAKNSCQLTMEADCDNSRLTAGTGVARQQLHGLRRGRNSAATPRPNCGSRHHLPER